MSGVTVSPDQRTVFLGQVDPETTYEELCSIIHGGALESVRVRIPIGLQQWMALAVNSPWHAHCDIAVAATAPQIVQAKQCAFVAFIAAEDALSYLQWATAHPPVLRNKNLRVGWGKPAPLPADVAQAVSRGATRKVYLGSVRAAACCWAAAIAD